MATQANNQLSTVEESRLAHLKDMAACTSGASQERYVAMLKAVDAGMLWPVGPTFGPTQADEEPVNSREHIDVRPSTEEPVEEPDVPAYKVERWVRQGLGMSEIRERGERHIEIRERQARELNGLLTNVRENRQVARTQAELSGW